MKKAILLILTFIFVIALLGCSSQENNVKRDIAPTITLYDRQYVAPYMPIDELPGGYEYLGDLPEDAANDTGLAGCKMYAVKELDSLSDFYLYQECAASVDENTVDATRRQWAYVQWVLSN